MLFDLKVLDPERYRALTGGSIAAVRDSLGLLAAQGTPVVVRVPLVPGYTDDPGNVEAMARLAASLPNVRGVDLMRYNRLGESKWARLGRPCPLGGTQPQDEPTLRHLKSLVEREGLACAVNG